MSDTPQPAPQWRITEWLNSAAPLSLGSLRGQVIMLEVFQMLCPACVSHGLPQAQRVAAQFDPTQVAVLGLHSVFEHHAVMTPAALHAFVHEQRLRFPIGIDESDGHDGLPLTMQAYQMRGTPTVVLIDRAGCLRLQQFGSVTDLYLGAAIAQLLCEPMPPPEQHLSTDHIGCGDNGAKRSVHAG